MPDEQDATAPASSSCSITPIAPRQDIETVANR